jgi:hypothetical protein
MAVTHLATTSKPVAFPELSVVALRHAVQVEARSLPQGAQGTVVAAYADGQGYEVEFNQPFHVVVTLGANDLK